MKRMHDQYRKLESGHNYIDKTESLEKEIERFPSVYIEGAAGCGKTTMMRMVLEKHPEVDYAVFWMDEADDENGEKYKKYEQYVDKYVDKCANYVDKCVDNHVDNPKWLILENVPEELPSRTAGMIKRNIRRLRGQDRIILIGRDEIECMAKQYESGTSPEQLLQYTGGWAGIVDVILRLEGKYGAWSPGSFWHEMNCYIKEMILDTLQQEEVEILHLAQYVPWVNDKLCEEILGIAHAEEILGRMVRKGY